MLKFYGYKKCGTSRKGEKALQVMGIEYQFSDITENPPSESALKKMFKQSGEPVKKFFNTSGGEYKSLNIKEKLPNMTDAEAIKLLASNGRLIKRPIVTDGTRTTVGFDENKFNSTWK